MCDPVTLTATAVAISAASAGVAAYGSYAQQEAANASAEYQSQIATRNAEISETLATNAEEQGEADERTLRANLSKYKGAQRSSLAASGVVVDTGSSLDTVLDTQTQGELDALTIKRNAAMDAWGYRNQGVSYQAQSQLAKMSMSSPWYAGGSSLLTGLSSTAGTAASLSVAM